MIQVLPAILAKDEQDFLTKLSRVRGFAPMVHIDVMDGNFVDNTTWADPTQITRLLDGLPFEAHIMTDNPEHLVPVWIAAGADRVIFHAEATDRELLICRATENSCRIIGLALNPETPISRIAEGMDKINNVMVMGVPPGKSGQPFVPISMEKISAIAQIRPGINIIVDGGVNKNNAADLVRAGATILVAGSAILEAPNPEAAYHEILTAARSGEK